MSGPAEAGMEPAAPVALRPTVNPYSLLAGVNEASQSARATWLLSLAVMAWLFIATAGVSHKDLLLGGGVALPLLQVEIDIRRLFIFAPIVLLFIQFGLLMQHAQLAQKVLELDQSLRAEEGYAERDHPLRLELDSHFLTQIIAGPTRSRWLERLQHVMSWLSFVCFPIVLLLVVLTVFLPMRDPTLTWVHRGVLVAHVGLLAILGVLVMRPVRDWSRAFAWTLDRRPLSVLSSALLIACSIIYAFAISTTRDGILDRRLGWIVDGAFRSSPGLADLLRPARELRLRGADLTRGPKDQTDVAADLRDRDIRFADFTGALLRRAEFSGSRLDGARFMGADLRDARFGCRTEFERMTARTSDVCVSLRRTDFTGADLAGAVFEFADLEDAQLSLDRFAKAVVKSSSLVGVTIYSGSSEAGPSTVVNFGGSKLDRANLAFVDLRHASLVAASLVEASLIGAKLGDADLSRSDLSRADLSGADLRGANLSEAILDGANLSEARLEGARVTPAQLARARSQSR